MDVKANDSLPTVDRSICRTASGDQYDKKDDVWGPFISGGRKIYFDFSDFSKVCSARLVSAIKNASSERLNKVTAGTAMSGLSGLRAVINELASNRENAALIDRITKDQLDYALLSKSASVRRKTSSLLIECPDALTEEAYDYISNFKKNGNADQKHDVVLTLDPHRGPYLDAEILAADNALMAAFEAGSIDRHRYLLVMTFRLYGIRPVTCSEITLGDVDLSNKSSVSVRFRFNKQRNAARSHSPFRPAPLLYASLLREEVSCLSEEFSSPEWQNLPLFPYEHDTWSSRRNHTGYGQIGDYTGSSTISERYRMIMDSLDIISPRTGEKMKMSPRRDRHTVATQLALQGCSAEVIAAWMLHSDITSCEVYVELATKHYQVMDSLLDGKFTHFAGRFFGEIIAAEELNDFGDVDTISDFEHTGDEVGGCAAGGCSAIETLSAPYACFTCPNFRLSKSANLEPLLKALIAKRRSPSSAGHTEYLVSLDRHLAATYAAKQALETSDE